jgi:uncharacterized membrane protein YphA (DoxX/SURF4 family)
MSAAVPETLSGSMLRSHVRTGARIALGLLFVWAGVTKLLGPRAFAAAVSRFDIVPEPALPVVAIGLPLIELAAGLGAVTGRRGALHAILAMLALFSLVLGFAFLSGLDVDCGCFGPDDNESLDAVRTALLRDFALILVTGWLLWTGRREIDVSGTANHHSEPEEIP